MLPEYPFDIPLLPPQLHRTPPVAELPTTSQGILHENFTRVSDISLSKQNKNLPSSLWRITQGNSSTAYEFTLSFLSEAVH